MRCIYDERRVQLTLHTLPGGQVDGFVAVCQTGYDLFVPLVVLRAPAGAVDELLREALQPGRPYTVIAPIAARPGIERAMVLDRQQVNRIYRFESADRPPRDQCDGPAGRGAVSVRNSVARGTGGLGGRHQLAVPIAWPRCMSIPSREYQGRGWATAVGAACVRALLEKGLCADLCGGANRIALLDSVALALGFRETGAREFECRGQLR